MSRYSRWGFFKNRDVGSANIFVPYVNITSTVSNVNSTVTYNIDTNYSNTEFTYDLVISNNLGQFELVSNLDFTDGIASANIVMDADGNATVTKDLEILNRVDPGSLNNISGELQFRLKYGDRILADDWADDTKILIDIKGGMDATGGYKIVGGRSIDMIPVNSTDAASNVELSNIDIINENNYYAFNTHVFYETDVNSQYQTFTISYLGDEPDTLLTNISLSNTYIATLGNTVYTYDNMTLDCVAVSVGRGGTGSYFLTGNPSPNDYFFAQSGGGGVSRSFLPFSEWTANATYNVEISDGTWTNGSAGWNSMNVFGDIIVSMYPSGNAGTNYNTIANIGNGGTGGWIYSSDGKEGSALGDGAPGSGIEWGHCNVSPAAGVSTSNVSTPRPIGSEYDPDPVDWETPWGANAIISEQFNQIGVGAGRGRLSSIVNNSSGFKARCFDVTNKFGNANIGYTADYTTWPSTLDSGFAQHGTRVTGNVSPTQKTLGSGVVLHGAGGNVGRELDANVPGRFIPAAISSQPGANGVVLVRYISKYRKLRKFINP